MNKNIAYMAIGIVILIVVFMLSGETAAPPQAPTVQISQPKPSSTQATVPASKSSVKIHYSTSAAKNPPPSARQNTAKSPTVTPSSDPDKQPALQTSVKLYELINTGTYVGNYHINIVSNSPIPSRGTDQFPLIPASIVGKIDGQGFALTIPTDLEVKDFKVRIKNEKTGEIKSIVLLEEHIKQGASSVLNIDTNNFANIELRSEGDMAGVPMPPVLPPLN